MKSKQYDPAPRLLKLLVLALLVAPHDSRHVSAAPQLPSLVDGQALDGCRSAAFSSDGKRIAGLSGNPAGVRVWDCETGRELLTIGRPGGVMGQENPAGNPMSFSHVLFSPDNERLITTGIFPAHGLATWDARSGQLLNVFGTNLLSDGPGQKGMFPIGNSQLQFFRAALSPDGKLVYAAAYDYGRFNVPAVVGCWDTISETLRFSIQESSGTLRSLVLSPDRKHLAAWLQPSGMAMASRGGPSQQGIAVWDALSGERKHTLAVTFQLMGGFGPTMTFSPDGRRLAVFAGVPRARPGGAASASAGAQLHLWDVETGKALPLIPLKDQQAQSCSSIVFNPDGSLIALVLNGKQVSLVQPSTGKVRRSLNSTTAVNHVAFSADGKLLAAACGDPNEIFGSTGDVKLWRVADAKLLRHFPGQRGYASQVQFSPDGKRLLSLNDVSMVLWKVPSD